MRAGETPQQVSTETGWPIDRVERYAEQPLAERAFIADQALLVEIRRTGAGVSVRDSAVEVLARLGIPFEDLVVDSARRADGKWTIQANVPGQAIAAEWVYDHGARSLQPANDDARRLMGVEPDLPVSPVAAAEPEPVRDEKPVVDARPHLVAVPNAVPEAEVAEASLIEPEPDEPEPAAPSTANQDTLSLPIPAADTKPAAAAKPKPRAKGRRASVPSWDEILFGSSSHDGD